MSGHRNAARMLSLVLYFIALHSLLTGIGLIVQPGILMRWGGWGEVTQPFFPAQGGVFHVLMAFLYARAAWHFPDRAGLLPFIIFVKLSASGFLFAYYFFAEQIWLVLLSGALDGAIAAVLIVLHDMNGSRYEKL